MFTVFSLDELIKFIRWVNKLKMKWDIYYLLDISNGLVQEPMHSTNNCS